MHQATPEASVRLRACRSQAGMPQAGKDAQQQQQQQQQLEQKHGCECCRQALWLLRESQMCKLAVPVLPL